MEYVWLVVSAILAGGLIFIIVESIKTPDERTIQVITRFDKFHAAIMSVEGYRLNVPGRSNFVADQPEWEIIPIATDYTPSLSEKWNIYFYLWPFCKTYVYPFSYTKLKKRGDVAPGDIVIWTDEKTGESVISRSGMSDHIDFQVEYPTITGNLFTSEMAKVLVFTNNTLRATNPFKMLFRVNNWLGVTTETLGGALRGIVGKLSIQALNQVEDSATTSDFTRKMEHINMGKDDVEDGIEELWGVKLTKSIFKAFTPADAQAEALMNSFLKPQIATQEGDAAVIKAERDAHAYSLTQSAIVEWRKKYLVDTGLAKVDAEGKITELVPEANVRVSTEALKELAKLTGTLVMGDTLKSMLSITPTTTSGGPKP